jgi:hypothetical protein
VKQSQLHTGDTKMIPEMPALIPTNPGNLTIPDELNKKILEQMKLVEELKHTLVNEQKTLELLWKAKHKDECQYRLWIDPSQRRIAKICSQSTNSTTLSGRTQSTVVSPTLVVKKNQNYQQQK